MLRFGEYVRARHWKVLVQKNLQIDNQSVRNRIFSDLSSENWSSSDHVDLILWDRYRWISETSEYIFLYRIEFSLIWYTFQDNYLKIGFLKRKNMRVPFFMGHPICLNYRYIEKGNNSSYMFCVLAIRQNSLTMWSRTVNTVTTFSSPVSWLL